MDQSPEADVEGQRILAELQRSGWIDDDLDYEQVMAELANGENAARAIALDRHRSRLIFHATPTETDLMARLVKIARAPWVDLPLPETPAVDLTRFEADFHRTTGRHLGLSLRFENYPNGGVWLCDIAIDGTARGATGIDPDLPPEELLLRVIDQVSEGWIMEEVWGAWPMCPDHPDAYMGSLIDTAGKAVWQCRTGHRTPVGRLGLNPSGGR